MKYSWTFYVHLTMDYQTTELYVLLFLTFNMPAQSNVITIHRGSTDSQVGRVCTWPLLLSCIISWSKIYRWNYRRYFWNYYIQIGPRYTWTMLTLFNCLSTTEVKEAIVFYYNVHVILYTPLIACHACMWPCFVHFCYAKVALPKLLKEPHQLVFQVP